ncbi:hypothetical protein PIB30_084357 [Stylosanthes scabra]|uniref:Uncharacterized protein n=1 Tax=Stylosanthes scabra TaxID=79078 RepID=A0ABU6YQS7_9FABA|nr:hypothetical protein [Stylosanthes scabra]
MCCHVTLQVNNHVNKKCDTWQKWLMWTHGQRKLGQSKGGSWIRCVIPDSEEGTGRSCLFLCTLKTEGITKRSNKWLKHGWKKNDRRSNQAKQEVHRDTWELHV